MRKRNRLGLVIVSLATTAVAIGVPAANADTSAQGSDAVLVGSDTLQYASTFVSDGDPGGDFGYNSTQPKNRIADFFATGDANGRSTGAGGLLGSAGNPETVILRGGTQPVTRPNGSGQGVGALIADSTPNSGSAGGYRGLAPESINVARMSRLPSSGTGSEEASCDAITACGGLHVYEIAHDALSLVKLTSGSDVVPLDADQLWNIYNCSAGYTTWNASAIGGTSTDTIIPVIPQSGSGTRNFFLATIDAASGHGTTNPSLSTSCVVTAQEHDPTGVTLASNPKAAVEPFSGARLALINGSSYAPTAGAGPYFNNSGTAAGTPVPGYTTGGLTAVTGTSVGTGNGDDGSANNGSPTFSTVRAVYLTVRVADTRLGCSASSTPSCFASGGTKNIVNALISGGPSSIFRSNTYAPNIVAAGFTAMYQDCGTDPDSSASSTNTCLTSP